MRKKAVISKAGFTFFEVLVAVLILSVGIVPVYKVFFTLADAFKYLENRRTASYIADAQIWTIKNILSSGRDAEPEELVYNQGDYPRYLITSSIYQKTKTGLYEGNVKVEWKNKGKQRSFSRTLFLYYPEKGGKT